MKPFPYRQVHLDFHTSPDIPGIGKSFDKEQFRRALREGHLDSITVFAKCHHGYCYYPTEVGTKNPNLDFDLTGAMIDAAHSEGVRAPVYITAGWSQLDAENHPEWIVKDKEGNYLTSRGPAAFHEKNDEPKPEAEWFNMCLNDGSYCRHIYSLTEEICRRYRDLDGMFFDIVFITGYCFCDECRAGMKAEGLDPDSMDDARRYYREKRISFIKKCGDILHKYHPDATIFFNSGGADPYMPEYHPYSTHYELEDLPTVWGGYDKLPIRAKYFASKGKPAIGMTGKFHLSWGEFGGFKTKEALKYECVTMLMNGVGCSVGDHLHPDGEMDMQTYLNIGYAYSYLEKVKPYFDGEEVAEIGLVFSNNGEENVGISSILLENQIGFDLVTPSNVGRFKAVIVHESSVITPELEEKLVSYYKEGGKLLLIGNCGKNNTFLSELTGIRYLGASEYSADYVLSHFEDGDELPETPQYCYSSSCVISSEGETFAEVLDPYFNRTYRHFCGHKNTPYDKHGERRQAIVKNGSAVACAHNFPLMYAKYGNVFHKRFLISALGLIFEKKITVSLGSQCRTLLKKDGNDYLFNVTYVSPVRRGAAEIIEDIVTLKDVEVKVGITEKVKEIFLPLDGISVPFKQDENGIRFVIPSLSCHNVAVIRCN